MKSERTYKVKVKGIIILFFLSIFNFQFSICWAEVPVERPDLSVPTGIAPAYFGPNAFPIPDMSDGETYDRLRLELAADGYFGYKGDRTADLFARAHIPLFTRWANLSVWMPVYEWYDQRTLSGEGLAVRGGGAGDVYITTDVQVLHNSWFKTDKAKYIPQIVIRLGMKTASGGQFELRRHYDCPGYFFDGSIGGTIPMGPLSLRLAGSAGFLCWQTDNGRQNDAVMYGLQANLRHEYVSLQATWGGYFGWEEHGDAPMSLKVRLAGHVKGFEPFAMYQWGIQDYPFHQIRIGLAYNIKILK